MSSPVPSLSHLSPSTTPTSLTRPSPSLSSRLSTLSLEYYYSHADAGSEPPSPNMPSGASAFSEHDPEPELDAPQRRSIEANPNRHMTVVERTPERELPPSLIAERRGRGREGEEHAQQPPARLAIYAPPQQQQSRNSIASANSLASASSSAYNTAPNTVRRSHSPPRSAAAPSSAPSSAGAQHLTHSPTGTGEDEDEQTPRPESPLPFTTPTFGPPGGAGRGAVTPEMGQAKPVERPVAAPVRMGSYNYAPPQEGADGMASPVGLGLGPIGGLQPPPPVRPPRTDSLERRRSSTLSASTSHSRHPAESHSHHRTPSPSPTKSATLPPPPSSSSTSTTTSAPLPPALLKHRPSHLSISALSLHAHAPSPSPSHTAFAPLLPPSPPLGVAPETITRDMPLPKAWNSREVLWGSRTPGERARRQAEAINEIARVESGLRVWCRMVGGDEGRAGNYSPPPLVKHSERYSRGMGMPRGSLTSHASSYSLHSPSSTRSFSISAPTITSPSLPTTFFPPSSHPPPSHTHTLHPPRNASTSSAASVRSDATFPLRPHGDTYIAHDLTHQSRNLGDSPPHAPSATLLPYPSLAQGVGIRTASSPSAPVKKAKGAVGFFASLGRKGSNKSPPKPGSGGSGSTSPSKGTYHLPPPPVSPSRSTTPLAPLPREVPAPLGPRPATQPQKRSSLSLGQTPAPASALAPAIPSAAPSPNDAWQASVERIADVLPHAERGVLEGCLRRANGDDMSAITLYLEAERRGEVAAAGV